MPFNKSLLIVLFCAITTSTLLLGSVTTDEIGDQRGFEPGILSNNQTEALRAEQIAANVSSILHRRLGCNLAIVVGAQDSLHSRVAEEVKEKLSHSHPTIVVLNFVKNFSYYSPILDQIVRWKSTCSDYVVFLPSSRAASPINSGAVPDVGDVLLQEAKSVMEDVEFVVKIFGRDRNPSLNIVLPVAHWEATKSRLRNFPDVCLFAADDDDKPKECRTSATSTLSGRKLKITGFPALPAVIWNNLPDGTITNGDGVDFLMITDLAERFNFSFSLEPPSDGFWGHMSASGVQVFGMTGQVAHGEADMAIGDFFQMYALSLAADYPLYSRGCTAISVPNPTRYEVWQSVATIFAPGTWLLLLAANIVPFLATWMPDRGLFSRNYGPRKRPYVWTEHLRIFLDSEPWEAEFAQESLPTRLIINGFAVLALFVTNLFEAAFFGKLTAPEYYAPIGSLDDLLLSGLPIRMNSLFKFLKDAYPQHRSALEKSGSSNVPFNFDEALALVASGKAATVEGWHETIFAQKVRFSDALGNNPQFYVINRCFMPANAGWVTPKQSYYGEKLSTALQKMNEAGLIDKYRRDVTDRARLERSREAEVTGTEAEAYSENPELVNLTMRHMSWVFALYAIGLGLAVVVFLYELCCPARATK